MQGFTDSSFSSYKDCKFSSVWFKFLFHNTCCYLQSEDGVPAVLLHAYNIGDVEPLFAGSYSREYFMLTVINLLDQ